MSKPAKKTTPDNKDNPPLNGYGTFVYPNGDRYEGEWKDGKRSGQGKLLFNLENKRNSVWYEGTWEDDSMNGYGVMLKTNGSRYEGEWKNNEKSGRGTLIWQSGDRFEGSWRADEKNGQGTYFWHDGSSYEDEHRDGKYLGRAIYRDGHGRITRQYPEGDVTQKGRNLLIERGRRPNKYIAEGKFDNIYLCYNDYYPHIVTHIVINDAKYYLLDELVPDICEKYLSANGFLLIRLSAFDFSKTTNEFLERTRNLLMRHVKDDKVEFISQCIASFAISGMPVVKTMLIGITARKRHDLRNKVRFISMPDKLEEGWEGEWGESFFANFRGVPFTREECLSEKNFTEVPCNEIEDLHPFAHLPLNDTLDSEKGHELGEFMMLCPGDYADEVNFRISYPAKGISQGLFDSYTDYVREEREFFGNSERPFYRRMIIDRSSIVFSKTSNSPYAGSLLVKDPQKAFFINYPYSNDNQYTIAVCLKPGYNDRVDIEYIYLQTRKREFLNQFYFYNGGLTTIVIAPSTILKARIRELPALDIQREIVRQEKEKFFNTQKQILDSHMMLLDYEEERRSLDRQLSQLDARLSEIRKGIVDSDPRLKKVIGACGSITEERRKEAEDILYYLLPIKKCLEEGNACSAPGFGNKSRILIECVIHTLKSMNVIPGSYDVSKSVKHLCRKKAGWSSEIPEDLQQDLSGYMHILHELSHKEAEEKPDQIIKILTLLTDLMEWLKEFTARNSDIDRNFRRWGVSYEQMTPGGVRKLRGVNGVVTRKWISRDGVLRGAFMTTFDTGLTISISTEKTLKLGLGYGSIVEVNAVERDEKWRSEEVTVINNCPFHYMFPPPDPTHFRRERRRNENNDDQKGIKPEAKV